MQVVFDTGAPGLVLDESLKPELGEPMGKITLDHLGTREETDFFASPDIQLGKWRLHSRPVTWAKLSPIRALLGFGVQGILGIGPWPSTAIDFNFDEKRLRFISDFNGESRGVPYVLFKKPQAEMTPILTVSIENTRIDVIIDSGSNACINCKHEAFEKLMSDGSIILDSSQGENEGRTLKRILHGQSGHFSKGTLLGVPLKGMPVQDVGTVNTLGMQFLINLDFTIDYATNRFYFKRRQCEPPLREFFMLGAIVKFLDGALRVANLLPESTAANGNLKEGDEILKLGPLEKRDLSLPKIYALCQNRAGETLEVKVARPGQAQIISTRLKLPPKQFVYPERD
jgi:hypothetical protein